MDGGRTEEPTCLDYFYYVSCHEKHLTMSRDTLLSK